MGAAVHKTCLRNLFRLQLNRDIDKLKYTKRDKRKKKNTANVPRK